MEVKIEDIAGSKGRWSIEGMNFDEKRQFTTSNAAPVNLSKALQSLITDDISNCTRLALEIAKRCVNPCCGNCFYHSGKTYYAKGKNDAVVRYKCANPQSDFRKILTRDYVTCDKWRCEKLFWYDSEGRIELYWQNSKPYPRRKKAFEDGETFIASEDEP